jgi:adenylate cyclase
MLRSDLDPGEADQIGRNCFAACAITDAEGYTGVAEGMEPARLVDVVNSYFKALFGAVMTNRGSVLDVKGDGILAVWADEAPDVELRARACRAALQMLEAADRFNLAYPASRLPTRIGVDFGPIALARLGAFARYEYRAVGDTVNTCSRLEQLNKKLGTRLVVSQQLADGLDDFLFRDLGLFVLRGKRASLRVLELIALRESATRWQIQLCQAFARALSAYDNGRSEEALRAFRALRERFPQDGPTRFFLRRCSEWRRRLDVGPATAQVPLALALS